MFSTGSIHLMDTSSILMLASFPYEGELYYINTDIKKTYISKIENKKLINVGLVAEESIWTYEPEVIHTTDNHYVVFFNNRKTKGYVDISGNKIELVRFK